MINKIIVLLLFTCACEFSQAQVNLIKNGGFEYYTLCPTNLDEVSYAKPWNGIDTDWTPGSSTGYTRCLPDYINACSIYGSTSEPVNGRFYQDPHSGKGMMQMVMYNDTVIGGHVPENNYLQGKLYSILIPGQSYCVTFYANLENESGYAINNIGAYLDDGTIDTTSQCNDWQTQYVPQILDTSIIRDTLNWIKIQGSFIANGTESFITIGNFFDTAHTEHIRLNFGTEALYLIDDVSVIASNATAYAGPDVAIAAGDSTYIGVDSNGDGMPCYWYKLGGTTPIDSGGRILVRPTDTTTYVVSMDLCGNVTYDTVAVWVNSLAIQNVQMQNVQLYPNPATTEIAIANAKNADLVITNVLGSIVSKEHIFADKQIINISNLPEGIYTAQFTNSISGERSTKKIIKK